MFDNKQETNIEIYREEVLEEYSNPIKKNRDMELIMLITPSNNLFKAQPWGKVKPKVFETIGKARTYLKNIQKKS